MSSNTDHQHKPQSIPCLVLPNELHFSVSHTRYTAEILTLYNPLNIQLQYIVLSNNVQQYIVEPSNGIIGASSSIKIYIKLKPLIDGAISYSNSGVGDSVKKLNKQSNATQFKIELFNKDKSMYGSVLIPVVYSKRANDMNDDDMHITNTMTKQHNQLTTNTTPTSESHHTLLYTTLLLPIRLLPLLCGSMLVYSQSDTNNVWSMYMVGLVTSVIQMKFLEISK